jgi:hypothetical protein
MSDINPLTGTKRKAPSRSLAAPGKKGKGAPGAPFLLLQKKEGAKKGRPRKKNAAPGSLSFEMESTRASLNDLATMVEREIAHFIATYHPATPAERIYQSEYERRLGQIAWYYRRMASELSGQDLKSLEDCLESVKACRASMDCLSVLVAEEKEPQERLDQIKKAALGLCNGTAAPGRLMEAIGTARAYVGEIDQCNRAAFEGLPPGNQKNGVLASLFRRMSGIVSSYHLHLDMLEKFCGDKNAVEMVEGLIGLKKAESEMATLLGDQP